jgi:hypothetical protein
MQPAATRPAAGRLRLPGPLVRNEGGELVNPFVVDYPEGASGRPAT